MLISVVKLRINWGTGYGFVIILFLLIFSFDFTRIRKQNDKMIEQNERVIELLEEMKKKEGA
jgi:hypothetical protein